MFFPLSDDPITPVLENIRDFSIEEIDGKAAERIRSRKPSTWRRLPVAKIDLTGEANDDWLKHRPEHSSDLNLVY